MIITTAIEGIEIRLHLYEDRIEAGDVALPNGCGSHTEYMGEETNDIEELIAKLVEYYKAPWRYSYKAKLKMLIDIMTDPVGDAIDSFINGTITKDCLLAAITKANMPYEFNVYEYSKARVVNVEEFFYATDEAGYDIVNDIARIANILKQTV